MTTIILGAGLAGLSLANFLTDKTILFEKEREVGGLCRSYEFNGIKHDVGPHILFSKDKEQLKHLISLAAMNKLKRSNRVLYKGRFIKYPFENDLYNLPREDREYCLQGFLNNPYEAYNPANMQQFFLKTFGEGITRLYLQPYNEKIWKFDPSMIDLQMVERIPKPPREDIIKSANGVSTEGYKHQLHFYYPESGGIQSLIEGYKKKLDAKECEIITGATIKKITRLDRLWEVETDKTTVYANRLVNCMPLHELDKYVKLPKQNLKALRYNSIYIVTVLVKKEHLGDNLALYVPDKDVIFHRVTRLGFYGKNYQNGELATIMAEVTFRPKSILANKSARQIARMVVNDLRKVRLINYEPLSYHVQEFKYAYVIYDLHHRNNVDTILEFLRKKDIRCCGRFAEFEYLNMDGVVAHSKKLADELNKTGDTS